MAAPSVEDLNSRLRARSSRGVEQQRSDSSVTGAHSRRRGDIQGLRAVAILLVVAFHAGLPVPGGFMGVDVFFAISGFVITAMLVAELESSGLNLGTGYFDVGADLNPLLHTWTLAVEEQFYIVFPALLLVSWKLGARGRAFGSARAAAALTLGAVCAGSLLLSLSLSGGWLSVGRDLPRGWRSTDRPRVLGSSVRARCSRSRHRG